VVNPFQSYSTLKVGRLGTCLVPPLWNFETKLISFVCAFNPVVFAQPLPKLFNFQSGGGGKDMELTRWIFSTEDEKKYNLDE